MLTIPRMSRGRTRKDLKIFQIGFNKCGTRSLVRFFRRNRIPSTHWSSGVVGHAFRYNLVTGRRPLEGFEEFVFYADMMGPFGEPIFEGHFYYKELYDAYPGSLFILNTRDEDRWIRSRRRHPDFTGRFIHGYGLKDEDEVEIMWREMWRSHHAGVRKFFADKPGVLMEFDIEREGGAELSRFLAPYFKTDPVHWGQVGQGDDNADEGGETTGDAAVLERPAKVPDATRQPGPRQPKAPLAWLRGLRGEKRAVLPIALACDALGLPRPAPGAEPLIGPLLEANAGRGTLRPLLKFKAAPLHEEKSTLLGEAPNPSYNTNVSAAFRGTKVLPLIFEWPTQRALELKTYRDVFLIGDGQAFAIWQGDTLEEEATGLPVDPARGAGRAERLKRAALCDDVYIPRSHCHFMFDKLANATLLMDLAGVPEEELLFFSAVTEFNRFALQRTFPKAAQFAPGTVCHVEELLILSTCLRPKGHPFHYLRKASIDAIVPPVLEGIEEGPMRKIYLSRFDSRFRPLKNEKEVAAYLDGEGFEVIEMGGLSPADQFATMRGADMVVAPHGAALTASIAARPGAHVIELFNPARGVADYAATSLLAGAGYTPLFGEPVEGADEKHPWTFDKGMLAEALKGTPRYLPDEIRLS